MKEVSEKLRTMASECEANARDAKDGEDIHNLWGRALAYEVAADMIDEALQAHGLKSASAAEANNGGER